MGHQNPYAPPEVTDLDSFLHDRSDVQNSVRSWQIIMICVGLAGNVMWYATMEYVGGFIVSFPTAFLATAFLFALVLIRFPGRMTPRVAVCSALLCGVGAGFLSATLVTVVSGEVKGFVYVAASLIGFSGGLIGGMLASVRATR